MWIVNCSPPQQHKDYFWPFADNYFPRKFAYKREAHDCANTALKHKATNVTVKKTK